MKVISQLIDYFLNNGMLSSHDEEFLREKGYIKKNVGCDADFYFDEEYEQETIEDDDDDALPSEARLRDFETGRSKKSSGKSGGSKSGKKQIKADEICEKLKDLLSGKLGWLNLFKGEAHSENALKVVVYLNNLPKDSLRKHLDNIFKQPKSVIADFLYVIFEADFYRLCKNRCGIPVVAYKKAISGLEYHELEKYRWILRWDEINLASLLVQLRIKVISLLSENLEHNYISLIKKLKAAKGNAGILSIVVFLYMEWYNKYLDTSNPELLYTTVPDGTVRDIGISNDGKYIAFSASAGYIKVLKADNKQEVLHIEETKTSANACFTFFKNEDKIVVASENAKKLQFFDLSNSRPEFEYNFSTPVLALSVSPNDKLLLIKTTSEFIIFDVETKREIFVQENLGLSSCFHFIDEACIIITLFGNDFNIEKIRCFNYEKNEFGTTFNNSSITNEFLSPLCYVAQNKDLLVYIEQGNNEQQKSLCELNRPAMYGRYGFTFWKEIFKVDIDSKYIYSVALSRFDNYLLLGCAGYVQCLNLSGDSIHTIHLDNKKWAPSICCSTSTGVFIVDCDDKIFSIDYECFINKFISLKNLINIDKEEKLSHLLAKFPVTTHPLAFYNSWLIYKQYHSIGFGEYLNMINKNLID